MFFRSAFAALVLRRYIAEHVRRHARGSNVETRIEGLLRRLRERLVKSGDPHVSMRIGKRDILLPLSHDLPVYFALVPTYDRVLPAIAHRLRKNAGEFVMIDVGANVGDSAALVADAVPDASFLCVEGSAGYFALLERNVSRLALRATCVRAFCGDVERAPYGAMEHGGTGALVHVTGGSESVKTRTLDDIISTQPAFRAPTLLKVDTDGFDVRVLHGADGLLRGATPVLFFEYFAALIRDAGGEPTAIFPWLAGRGYSRAELFTNQGVSLGRFDLSDDSIATAAAHAVATGLVQYLDVLAWPPKWDGALA